jgi:hypothetical protein
MTTEVPLIYTSKGNVPIDSLEYKTIWDDNENYISFTEQYFDGDELVKSSTHVYSKKPLEFTSESGSLL